MGTSSKKINNYYILVFDSIWENPIGKKPNYLAVFLYILSKANKKDKEIIWNNKKTIIKRGQWLGSVRQIADQFGLSTGTVHYILKYLKLERIVEHKATKRFSLFTVLNYDRYQPILEHTFENKLKTNKKQIETTDKDNNDNKDNIYNIPEEKISSGKTKSSSTESGKKPIHTELVEYFDEVFRKRFGYPYNWLKQDFVLMSRLVKRYEAKAIRQVINRFLSLDKDDWIAKQGYTIPVMFKYFSTLISSKSPYRN